MPAETSESDARERAAGDRGTAGTWDAEGAADGRRAGGESRRSVESDRAAAELTEVVSGLRRVTRRLLRPDTPPPRLSGAQVELLRIVSDRPGIGVTATARHLHLADNSVSTLVNQLAAKGMLLREPDPADRRAARLWVTEEARRRMARWRERRARLVGAAFDKLSDADRDAVEAALPALRRLLERLEERS